MRDGDTSKELRVPVGVDPSASRGHGLDFFATHQNTCGEPGSKSSNVSLAEDYALSCRRSGA